MRSVLVTPIWAVSTTHTHIVLERWFLFSPQLVWESGVLARVWDLPRICSITSRGAWSRLYGESHYRRLPPWGLLAGLLFRLEPWTGAEAIWRVELPTIPGQQGREFHNLLLVPQHKSAISNFDVHIETWAPSPGFARLCMLSFNRFIYFTNGTSAAPVCIRGTPGSFVWEPCLSDGWRLYPLSRSPFSKPQRATLLLLHVSLHNDTMLKIHIHISWNSSY